MLTAGEIRTIRTILRNGGAVTVTMGRLTDTSVRTVIVNALADRGYIREWSRPYRGAGFAPGQHGRRTWDLMVTAEGCRALEGLAHLDAA